MSQTYIYKISPVRENLMTTMTESETSIISQHFEYLQLALSEKRLILAGPCLDAAFGIVIFRSESEEFARRFMNEDPAVLGGVFSAELHPFQISLSEFSET